MNIPSATYRVQLHQHFTLRDLEGIIDYLHSLGITAIYASPIFQATPGSMHGYDVTDPHCINREIGTLSDLKLLARKLKNKNMLWIQDIVPNHMAFHCQNFRLMDALERGSHSSYYHYFDIDWNHFASHLNGKLQIPFLGDTLEACVSRGEIRLSFSEKGFTVDYFSTSYPLSLPAIESLCCQHNSAVFAWREYTNMARSAADYNDWKKDKAYYLSSIANDEKQFTAILGLLDRVNNNVAQLLSLLDQQHYVLTFWKDSEREINYRRFFTVNELICLRMEDEAVFNEYHQFLHSLYKENLIQGLRIDHIDGLRNPGEYVSRLRRLFGDDCYIIAEKILESKEDIPEHWPLQGTSGYEFLAFTSQLLTSRKGAKELLSFYRGLIDNALLYKELVLKNKRMILEDHMAGEFDNLIHLFCQLGLGPQMNRDRLKKALGLFMISLPVYRIYPDKLPLRGHDISIINQTIDCATALDGSLKTELDYLRNIFVGKTDDIQRNDSILTFMQRIMQFTGPLTAKGVEDTTFYVYNALLSHDEVGDSPQTAGITVAAFHKTMSERQKNTPLSLNATSTHDTKRGEDARLRLNALCEFADDWKSCVSEWIVVNKKFHRKISNGKIVPEINDEYFIYQAIVGGFPEDSQITSEWIDRLLTYYTKVLREAKVHSGWSAPDTGYEEACHSFIRSILKPGSEFLETFEPLMAKIVARAHHYALAQTLLKITAPGIPDIYQGCELWDLSFVDPDNRRPVSYQKRMEFLSALEMKKNEDPAVLFSFLEDMRLQGIEKLYVTEQALNFRKTHNKLFTDGSYLSLQTTGKETIAIAFARKLDTEWVVVAVPLSVRAKPQTDPAEVQEEAEIALPENSPSVWLNIFTGESYQTQGRIGLTEILNRFPVALLKGG